MWGEGWVRVPAGFKGLEKRVEVNSHELKYEEVFGSGKVNGGRQRVE